ncbi:MAG: hypothetical protein EZS28_045753 [Streblomastix strix]|uniref:Uncharacterized protein n=1 Tax=Streblomastix strix TaxID=222440 RepID=A0A5J4TMN8_9EUKA|nr:MAG: hypothetical protein EZS28_045753 [Streblomastix strix]
MKAITSKRMIIEPEDNKTIKDPTTKPNKNKIMEIINQEKQNHFKQPHSKYELRNPNISLPKGQPPLITTPPELGQVKGKIVVPKQRIQPTNDHDSRNKTGQLQSVSNKFLESPEARANSDSSNHVTSQQEQRKKADVAPVTEDKSGKHSKGNKISAGSMKQKQRFNSENLKEIEPDSETDQPDQLD